MEPDGPLTKQAIIVVGASSGGIDALERLVATLPPDLASPVVIAQHLDPNQQSRLSTILEHSTRLSVVLVQDAADLLPGHVYVIPAGTDAEITAGRVTATKRKPDKKPIPSIDKLFASAAAAYGDRTFGAILSGTGGDGPAGVAAVKEAGGTILIQDPNTAAYPALPASIPPTLVDLVCGIDAMGSLISVMVSPDGAAARNVDDDMLHAFLLQLRSRSGIDFTKYKSPTIRRRLVGLMAVARCDTLSDYMRYLNANPEAYQRLVSSFLIKVTGFFRDPSLYECLSEQVLPDIISHAQQNKSELRIWSAGCATGEEPYSAAILLAELLGDEIDHMQIRIFATDLDSESIAFARRGIYPSSAFSDMPPKLLQKYFVKVDDSYQVTKRIRNLTVFGEYDLGQRAPFPRIDAILCRNVLIYFTKELQQRTLQLFAFSLREGGYLVLGKSETTSPLPAYFTSAHRTMKIFRRQGERSLFPSAGFTDAQQTERAFPRRTALRTVAAPRKSGEGSPRSSLSERLGSFLFESPIAIIVVDRNYDIQAINQAARQMLGILGQGIGEDLIHVANGVQANDLKSVLDDAFRRGKPSGPRELCITDSALNETKYLHLSCFPDSPANKDTPVSGVILLLTDITQEAEHRHNLQKEHAASRSELARLNNQNRELLERQRLLIDANNELTAANNELRNTNEHLLISAEEAEASSEEVETLNEEMQATSEELETLNEELQATIEELNTTNEELGARGRELERLSVAREERISAMELEADFFKKALGRLPAAALLDSSGAIVKTSEPYDRLASLNSATLPLRGDKWKKPPGSLELVVDGKKQRFDLTSFSLNGDGQHEVLLVLVPVA